MNIKPLIYTLSFTFSIGFIYMTEVYAGGKSSKSFSYKKGKKFSEGAYDGLKGRLKEDIKWQKNQIKKSVKKNIRDLSEGLKLDNVYKDGMKDSQSPI